MTERTDPARTLYDAFFAATPLSPTLEQISREAYGRDYLPELEAFSFITRIDLDRLVAALGVGPGDRLVDVGCGRGGPTLWISRETGCTVTGLDQSPVGAAHARQRAAAFGVSDRAAFLACDAAALPIADRSHDAAMSIEMLQLVPDRLAALRELARVLRPGAPLAFTAWEPRPGSVRAIPPYARDDYRSLLAEAGFTVEDRIVCDESAELERAWYARLLERREEVARELGPRLTGILLEEATDVPSQLSDTEKVLVTSRRTSRAA